MKISQFGRGIDGGITRGIHNSEFGRDVQRRANMRHADRATMKQQHYAQLMSNIHESLSSDAFTAQDAGQLKEALKIARGKNFEDTTHTRVSEFTGSTTIKVPHGDSGSTRQKVSLPAGWARDPSGRWINVTSSGIRPLTVAEIKKAEQIEAHNNQVDIENGTV